MTRLTLLLMIVVLLQSCAARVSQVNVGSPSQIPLAPAVDTGLTTVTLVDLVKSSKSQCVIESSTLVRCAGRLQINNLTNTSVQGAGVQVEFTDPTQGMGGIELDYANNVVFSNFGISWAGGGARDPIVPGATRIQSFGNVTACANQQSGGVLSLDLPLEGTQALGSASVWDDIQGWPWYASAANTYEVYFPRGATALFSAGRTNCLSELAGVVGHRVLMRHIVFSNHAFHCQGCQNVTVERVRITSAPGMGFVFEHGGSHISIISDVIAPACSPNCALPEPSITADGAHFADVAGDILLENNDFGWQGDDSVNITGLLVPARLDPTVGSDGQRLSVDEAWRSRLYTMVVGSQVSIYDAGLNSLGAAEILALDAPAGTLELSRVPDSLSNFLIARTAGIPNNVIIRNNHFHDNRARGILIGGSNALIENNLIERVTMEAILVPADTGPWYEGPGAQHVRIESNSISDVNRFPALSNYPSAISAGVRTTSGYAGTIGTPIQDIAVEGNSFTRVYTARDKPIYIGKGVSGAHVQGN